MTSLKDVALEAGTSTMTVSNVINGRTNKVSAKTRARVLEVVERLGYVPNGPARALSAMRSSIVALVYYGVPEGGEPLSNTHDSAFIGEVERDIRLSGRFLMIHAADDVVKTAANLRTWNVDGAIFLGTLGDEVDELRARFDVPMVFVDNYSDSPLVSNSGIDDYRGGLLAGRHLIEAGHERIAFVSPPMAGQGVIHQRFQGFSDALAEAGRAVDPALMFECDASFEDGFALARRLATTDDLPTAAFVTADIIAIGMLKGFATSGVDVPGAISLVGFDDLPESSHVTPMLTTIHQDIRAKGRTAAAMLLQLIEAGPAGQPQRTTLDVELVSRESVRVLK